MIHGKLDGVRVALVGGYGVTGSMAQSIEQAFARAGASVQMVGYAAWPNALPNVVNKRAFTARVTAAFLRPVWEARLIAEVKAIDPDLVLFIKSDSIHRTTYRLLRKAVPRAVLTAFHPDDPFRYRLPWTSGAIHRRSMVQIEEVDHFFVWSKALVERSKKHNPQSHLLLFGFDPTLFHPVDVPLETQNELGGQVVFIGNWDADREGWLSHLDPKVLSIWGEDYWQTRCQNPGPRQAWRGRALYGNEFILASLASAINLNVLRPQNKNACNMRTFELPATGAFMLHEKSEIVDEIFPPGQACDDFSSGDELRDKVKFYLANESARQRIAKRGLELSARFRYDDWVTLMCEHAGVGQVSAISP